MWAELSEIYRNIEQEDVKLPKTKPPTHIHKAVREHETFTSDKVLVKAKHTKKPIFAKNRLAIKRDDLKNCRDDILKFISHILVISKYGIFIDGIGHIYIEKDKVVVDEYYKVGSGNLFDNLVINLGSEFKEKLESAKKRGQIFESNDGLKDILVGYNRKVIPQMEIDEDKLKELKRQTVFKNIGK